MVNRREFLRSCAAGVGVLAADGDEAFGRILEAGRERAGLPPEQVAADEDFWFAVQQAFTEDRNIINLNNGTVQNGLRIVQDAVRRHSEFTGNAAWHSMAVLNKEIESCRRRLAGEARRQATSGPTPVRNSSSAASGAAMLLKKRGPTAILTPRAASETTGKSVPQNTTARMPMNTQLLSTKLASRETTDSRRLVLRSPLRRAKSSA